MSGSFRPPRSLNIIWPSSSSSIIHSLGGQWPEMLTCPKTLNVHTNTRGGDKARSYEVNALLLSPVLVLFDITNMDEDNRIRNCNKWHLPMAAVNYMNCTMGGDHLNYVIKSLYYRFHIDCQYFVSLVLVAIAMAIVAKLVTNTWHCFTEKTEKMLKSVKWLNRNYVHKTGS